MREINDKELSLNSVVARQLRYTSGFNEFRSLVVNICRLEDRGEFECHLIREIRFKLVGEPVKENNSEIHQLSPVVLLCK